MKVKVLLGSLAALVLVIGLIEVWSYWSYDVSHQLGVAHFKGETTEEMVRAIEILNDPQSPLGETIESLEVLGKAGHPRARLESLRLSEARTATQRQAAAVGLGYYSDPRASRNLYKLLSDPSLDVRLKAIEALSSVSQKSREKRLRRLLKNKDVQEIEKIMIYRSLYRISKDPKTKDEVVTQIRSFATDSKSSARGLAVRTLLDWDQSVGEAYEWAKDTLKKRLSSAEDLVEAIRILKRKPNEFDSIAWQDLLKHPAENVRLEMIQAILTLCPKDRWSLLKEIADVEQDDDVLRVLIRVAADLREPYSRTFLLDFSESGKAGAYPEDLTRVAEEWLDRLQKSPGNPRCR